MALPDSGGTADPSHRGLYAYVSPFKCQP